MIDIISSSIRLGRYIRDNSDFKDLYDFFTIQIEDEDITLFEYKKMLIGYFDKYGFYCFNYVDKVIECNLDNTNDIVRNISKSIKVHLEKFKNYNTILNKSKELGCIVENYITQLTLKFNTFPQIDIPINSLHLQQISNELSTSILRSGVFSVFTNPESIRLIKKESEFAKEYQNFIDSNEDLRPYCKKVMKFINGFDSEKKKIALIMENIRFIRFIVLKGITQGFFFELFNISENQIYKIKETHKDKKIHPVILKTSFIFTHDNLMLFKYENENRVSYLLAEKIVFKYENGAAETKLYGYSYPTNEYSLFEM